MIRVLVAVRLPVLRFQNGDADEGMKTGFSVWLAKNGYWLGGVLGFPLLWAILQYRKHKGKEERGRLGERLGRPGRARALAKFLDHVQAKGSTWITRRVEIAEHWRRVHPPA